MKIRYLLLGLMICVAGAGTINSSDGSFCGQNATPFLIFGHVWYESGSPCNNSIVNITNACTGVAWCADTVSGSDYYQTLLCGANVSLGDLLEFDVIDDVGFGNTSRVVNPDDLENGGIFGFNLTLLSTIPRIVGFAPDSPVYDTENATRRFNIAIDQVVDVTWLIDGAVVQTNKSTTEASYMNVSAAPGGWNVSAIASNVNGKAMQTWVWNVLSTTTLQPTAPFVVCGWVNYKGGGVCGGCAVNITNLDTDTRWQAETQTGYSYYELLLDSADVSAGDVIEFGVTDSVEYCTTSHIVDQTDLDGGGIPGFNLTLPVLAPFVDVELTPDDNPTMPGVQVINPDYLTTNRTVTITADVTDPDGYENITGVIADITGPSTVGDSPVSLTLVSNSSATTARYTGRFNMSDHPVGDYEVVVKATNTGGFTGTSSRSFAYQYEATAHLPLSPVIIYGSVSYDNDSACDSPFVVVTNLNTSEELIADNQTRESFYQIVTSSAFVKAGDVLKIDASKSGSPVGNVTHTVSQTDVGEGVIEVDINKADLPDFTVTNLTFNPSEPLIGDLVTINTTIANSGAAEGRVFVEICDNKSIVIASDDTITLPDSLKIRVHFGIFDVSSGGNITIHNETRLVEVLDGKGTDCWTDWCDGETIGIESWNAGFTVDRYEAVLANESITLGEGSSTDVSAKWNLSLQEMGWVTNGTHNITVRVDPCDQVIESDETNNEKTEAIDVNPSLDFVVTEVSLNPSEPVLGDVVEITAKISNYGDRDGTTIVGVYYDNRSTEILRGERRTIHTENESYTSTDNISLPSGVLGARLHFDYFDTFNGHVDICDENGRVVERIGVDEPIKKLGEDYWTDWIYGDNITVRIELPYTTEHRTHWCKFKIDRYEALITEEPVTLNATESKVISASWLTDAAYGGVGDHNITVVIDPHNHSVEINETNNTLIEQAFVNGTDLTVTAIEIPCGDDLDNPCYVGQDVNVTATIANIGAADAANFTVVFEEGTCSNESDANPRDINFSKIPRLNSGESRNVSVIWNPAEPLNRMITASIPYNESTDNNEENNKWFECAVVKERYDFTVESVDVTPQDGVRRGESVNITATIGSIGHAGGNVSIGFFVNSTDFAGTCGERFTRIGTIDDVYVEVGETETVSTTWDVDVVGGCHLIAAVVNPDNMVKESNGTIVIPSSDTICFRGETGNNVKNCTLQVNPLDLNMTSLTLDPAEPNSGEIVDISAKIKNNGDVEAESMVRFYMEKDESISGYSNSRSQRERPTTWNWSSALQPEVPIRFHIDYIEMSGTKKEKEDKGGEVNAFVTDGGGHNHTVHFYVKCENCGGQDVKVPRIDFDTTGFSEIDHDHRRWDDVWTDWTDGTTFEINATAKDVYDFSGGVWSSVLLSIDKYQVRLGNETVTLGPGKSTIYNSAWNASPPIKAGEYYRLMASVENQTRYTNETYIGGTDLAITNLSVKPAVYDGDLVWVNATIENLGRINATGFIVNFTEVYTAEKLTEGHIKPKKMQFINSIPVSGLEAGNATTISVPWNVRVKKVVFYTGGDPDNPHIEIADDYTINVKIDPLESTEKEENDANDSNTSEKVHVDKSRDFKITDLSFRVNNRLRDPSELVIYDDVTLNATLNITNLANQGGVVNVSFYIDEVWIRNTTVVFPAGNGTGYAEIRWKVENFDDVDITGYHNITVVVDLENMIYEIDNDQNNTYIQPINVMASDLLVESLEIHPMNPARGETVSIDATIANHGNADASNINLTVYDWAERHIEDVSEQSGLGRGQMEITRNDATAMKLYLDLEIDGGRVSINDSSRRAVIHYDSNFHGWTPWVMDNSTTVVVTDGAYARVSRVYYLASSSIINTSTYNIGINETRNITVNWNPPTVGERLIAAIVDPEDRITEHDEANNRLAELIHIQTADLLVSNLSLAWLNGTEIIKDGDTVRLSANITNIGVEDASSFDVRLLVDDLLIKNERMGGLAPDESMNVSLDWSATVGDHLIKVEADYRDKIDETNETNNIMALKRRVRGAELSGNTSWVTLGLLGEILFEPDQPYDEDEVNITARITNSGYINAKGFNAALFFDYTLPPFSKICGHFGLGGTWINRTYQGAEYVYINVTTPVDLRGGCRHIIEDDVIIYDGNGSEVARPVAGPEKPCWVRVNGDTANVYITTQGGGLGPVFDIYFYPIYQNGTSMLFEGIDVPVNSSRNLLMKRNVSAGDRTVMLIIDPEKDVPEDEAHRDDNTVSRIMHVKPTRDFTVTNVTALWTNLSDLDTPTMIANISNIGLRNGTADVSFVDYEVEHRIYGYHFDANRSPSYLPIPPDATLLKGGYDDLMIIHRPGVDAIALHFNSITLYAPVAYGPSRGKLLICAENGSRVWYAEGPSDPEKGPITFSNEIIPVPGETAYIYIERGYFSLDGYTTETEFHREEVRLNATREWNESKNVTPIRTAYTGDHTVTATLDRDGKIAEINESNNANSNLFHVNASRDPVIIGLNITPEHPGDGDNVDITAVIANNGSKNVSFTVDLWANLTRNEPDPDESLPDADLTTDMGGDRIRYITLLKHANLTLAPGENTTVNATWNDISVAGSPKYHIIAIVDPTDEIDEMNESNNEIVKEIIPNYPDLTIGTVQSGGGVKPVVPIIEIGGVSGASDVTVRFDAYETEECTESVHGWDKCRIYESRASNMQVHFDGLDSRDGYVIVNDCYSIKNYIEKYRGAAFAGVWSPWVEEDTVWIISMGGTTHAEIDEYRWGNVSDEQIDDLLAGGHEHVDMPWAYECPREINVTVDPDNNITEINEDNNNETLLLYADLKADRIEFVSPRVDMLSLDAEKFQIDGYITNGGGGGRNDIVYPVSDFNVTLEFRRRYQNGTIGDAVFNKTRYIEDPLCANEERTITFEFDPSEELEVGGNYTVFLIADSSGDICESNELYPEGEDNNVTSEEIYVYNTSGYTGGGDLVNVAQGEVNGRVVYTVGDEPSCRYTGLTPPGGEKTVRYTGVIPDANIEFARIFVYWFMYHQDPNTGWYIPEIADIGVTFNNNPIEKAGSYSDTSIGRYNYGYGLYSYDVKDHITRGENVATVTNNAQWYMGVAAIGLLVVYEDEDEPFTKYWVNEGADIVMAENGKYPTGLRDGDCITTATFEDVKRDDTENVNASLLTVMGMYSQYSSGDLYSNPGDALEFNGRSIGSKIGTGYWKHPYPHGIALTNDRWEDVTDDLERGDNLAEIHSKGNYMMPNNAFLRLIFPPDLSVINLTAPASTVVGAHHSINVTIRNDGRSDAHDFNATLEIDGRQMVRIPNLDLPAGENMTIHLYNWTPMLLLHSYNLTAAADVLSGEDWTEIETDNNALTKHVMIEEGGFGNQTGPRGTGGGSNPTGGEYTEKITGKIMQGTKESISGGGGAGMFSALEWIMKGAVWLVLALFVGLGYRMEQRSYGRVSAGYASSRM